MFRKEFEEMVKPTLLRLTPLLLFLLLYIAKWLNIGDIGRFMPEKAIYFIFLLTFLILLLWIACSLGINAFTSEHRDHAFEYLLSMPFSRWRLLYYKLMPRISMSLLFLAVFLIFVASRFEQFFEIERSFSDYFLTVMELILLMLFLLVSGFWVSLFESRQKAIGLNSVVILSTVLIGFGYFSLFKSIAGRSPIMLSVIAACLSVIVIGSTAFLMVYRRFDLRGLGVYGRRLTLRFMLPLLILDLGSTVVLLQKGLT